MGVITIKQAKKGVGQWKQTIKIEKIFTSYHLNHGNHSTITWMSRMQTKNSFHKIWSLSFNLGPLKMNTHYIKRNQFCKGLSKGLI
jgi:hypothetical protein